MRGNAALETRGGDYLLHARALHGWADYLAAKDIDYAALARRAGVDHVDPSCFESYVGAARFSHFLELAADACGDELAVLRWIDSVSDLALGPVLLCLTYAPTLRAAIDVLLRFQIAHVDAAACEIFEKDGITTVSWSYSPVVLWPEQLVDRGAALFIGRIRTMLPPDAAPLAVELKRRKPGSVALHHKLLGPDVTFEAERNAFSVATHLMDARNPNADANLFAALSALNERLVGERRGKSDMVLRVKEEILRRMSHETLALEPIARHLGYSSRGLQRRLAGYDTTFHNLLEQTRKETAKRYIEETDFRISEISYRLGFSTIGNFTRAAKRWFGCTPREYRQGLQGCPGADSRIPSACGDRSAASARRHRIRPCYQVCIAAFCHASTVMIVWYALGIRDTDAG
ncbi:AraC family transcriptional regulator [Breoghania sp. L-A4]|uniref:helix-turn-helix transcriptional regulator n=1 Tax=Breoghania sp. L-A4 TaxID=2304600 RepID=UPI0013C31F9C|nr:AraC family transcriptional regulator [Breoghania sp. L-A4]